MDFQLYQNGRASMDFASDVAAQLGPLSRPVAEAVRASGLDEHSLADDIDERDQQILDVALDLPGFRICNLVRDWYCRKHGQVAIEAFEGMNETFVASLAKDQTGPTTLDTNPEYDPPAWWADHWIHRTHGGWDGHPQMGFIYGELVHGYLVAKLASGDLDAQRRALAEALPNLENGHILEVGCSSGQFTRVLARKFPQANITACDISLRQLEHAQRTLNEMNAAIRLIKCSGENTGLAQDTIDAVVSYAILHEIPVDVTEATFREAFRVLKPGGLVLFGDVPPYEALDKFMQWRADFNARHEGEPFWRESATLDVRALLEEIGYTEIERFGMNDGPYPFPYVTRARKPEQ